MKITTQYLREQLDEILKEAEPLLKFKNLINHLHKRICFLEQDINYYWEHEPELEHCRNIDCEDCKREDCPEIRKFMSSLRWGENSINTVASLIGTWDMYCCGRKEYKDEEEGNSD